MKRLLCLLLLLLLPCAHAAAGGLKLTVPAARPYADTAVTVDAPRAGLLTVQLWNEWGPQLPLCQSLPVQAGRSELVWDGLSYGGMPLRAGRYRLLGTLLCHDGTRSTAQGFVTVDRPAAALVYALPSGGTLYHRRTEPWFVDCAVSGAGEVRLEIFRDEALTDRFASIRKKLNGSGRFRIAWNGQSGGRKAPEGRYWARASMAGRVEDAFIFPLDIQKGREPVVKLAPTGPLLPAAMDDRSVWSAMTAPVAVVDIEAESHQRLYEKPNPKSAVVGQVHGQSQAVEVVEPGGRYTLVRAWRHEDDAFVEGYVPTKKLRMIAPNPAYGLLIDKSAQTLTVYAQGRPIGQARVSTGLKAPDKAFRETRAGAFLTTDRPVAFESNGYQCDYPIRIDGGNLIHQVGYLEVDGGADFSAQQALLGQRASEGCVRVDWRTDERYAVNAYWLWTHLPYRTKVLVTP